MKEPQDHHENHNVDKAEQSLSDLGDTAANQAAAETSAGQGQPKFSDASGQTSDRFDNAARKASDALRAAAGGLRSYAPEQGTAGEITHQVAEGLEQGGSFLEEQSRKGVVAQTTNLVLGIAFLASLAAIVVVFLAWLGSRRQ